MARKIDPALESLFSDTEELIRDIPRGGIDTSAAFPQQEVEALADPSSQGVVIFTISKDHMLVLGTFFPPIGDGKPLEFETVSKEIESLGVATGIDWETIKRSVLTCNGERIQLGDVVIAQGKPPVNEIHPYLVMSPALKPQEIAEDDAPDRVNFREVSPFTIVKKGDTLASVIPRRAGSSGITVFGAEVAFRKQAIKHPKPGKNTLSQGAVVLAGCDGKFRATSAEFWIEEVLDIRGNVDFHVGNIDFPGNVLIQGEVKNGFAVKAGGSILCLGSLEACQIDCGGDLVTRKGILGGDRARIRVGGTTHAKFIEGCSLDSRGSINVATSVLNSNVRTSDRLEMGARSIIVGGTIQAQNGVSASQIGTARGPRTEIYCGIDFEVKRKLVWCKDRNIALAFKLRDVESRMKASREASNNLSALRDKIMAAIHLVNENAMALVSNLDRNENAEVSVHEIVYPGTYIEICHISYIVTMPKRFVIFQLDKSSGKIMEKKWEKRAVRPAAPDPLPQETLPND
jgi:uncharacterized protein (DUF342 family)